MRVSKTFKFSAAHRLSDCLDRRQRIHGHNYEGVVTIVGEVQENGILIDSSEIMRAVSTDVLDVFDHKLILKKGTTQNIEISNAIPEDWVVWSDDNPTAENLAEEIRDTLQVTFGTDYEVTIELFETDDCSAIAEPKENFGL